MHKNSLRLSFRTFKMHNFISVFSCLLFVFSINVNSVKSDDCWWTGCQAVGTSSYCPASTTLVKSSPEGCSNNFQNHQCCRGGAPSVFPDTLGTKYKVASEGGQNSKSKPNSNSNEKVGQIQNSKNGNPSKMENGVQRQRQYPPPQVELHGASTGNVVLTDLDAGVFTRFSNFFG